MTDSKSTDPPPYHDWTSIPDTALLPPPPSLSYLSSPTANASEDEGERAYLWCKTNPLWPPYQLSPMDLSTLHAGHLTLIRPAEISGTVEPVRRAHPGTWHVRTNPNCRDNCLQTSLPVYSAIADSPLVNGTSRKTVYFEIHIISLGPQAHHANPFARMRAQPAEEAETGIAIGFIAPPFPSWRLPGWQRGSLGVHGDDGRRYVNNTFGGVDFTTAFKAGETVGIGITWTVSNEPPAYEEPPPAYGDFSGKSDGKGGKGEQGRKAKFDAEVFLTRNGAKTGGWDLHEQLDEEAEGGTDGLEGEKDIFPAIGTFGAADFEVRFNPASWMYRPR
ncbi:hypothetical protein K402DRAFT_394672 [Aulographum hederae CBS 113979]|uniref:SPRY domain-containing protein n=1 Tax=Aulographum hederae CBS 113979 TaxID=1176131 RepID=A0A6G1GY25_9PEZI|nr:hypothetical protein K402DRAFT_394672 [Aulographum hederae CBS 113979]